MSDFKLEGTINEKDGLFSAEITLSTPDGRTTKIESGNIFKTKLEAEANLNFNMDRILDDFTKDHEVEVVKKTVTLD